MNSAGEIVSLNLDELPDVKCGVYGKCIQTTAGRTPNGYYCDCLSGYANADSNDVTTECTVPPATNAPYLFGPQIQDVETYYNHTLGGFYKVLNFRDGSNNLTAIPN